MWLLRLTWLLPLLLRLLRLLRLLCPLLLLPKVFKVLLLLVGDEEFTESNKHNYHHKSRHWCRAHDPEEEQ